MSLFETISPVLIYKSIEFSVMSKVVSVLTIPERLLHFLSRRHHERTILEHSLFQRFPCDLL